MININSPTLYGCWNASGGAQTTREMLTKILPARTTHSDMFGFEQTNKICHKP